MAIANPARFSVTGSVGGLVPSSGNSNGDKIYVARASETITLQLEDNPPVANSITYQIFDPNDSTSPNASATAKLLNSGGAPMYFQENSLPSYTPPSPSGTATLVMYNNTSNIIRGPMSWILRATATLANGQQFIFQRGLSMLAFPGAYREAVPGERDEFFKDGWGDSPLNRIVRQSFPTQSDYGYGTLNSVSSAFVSIPPSTRNQTLARTLIMVAQVWAREDGGATQGLWGLRRVAFIDAANAVTLSTNAGGETLDGTILEARFQPSIVVTGSGGTVAVSVKMDQKVGGHTYDWECWATLIEARR